MKTKKYLAQFCQSLKSADLFRLYQPAFELTTGCSLDVLEEPENDETAVSFELQMDRENSVYLVAREGHRTVDNNAAVLGLVEAFALQLKDEINRVVLQADPQEAALVKMTKVYLKERLIEKVPLEEVAEELEVCPFHLCRFFKKQTGLTMTEYVTRVRVEKARHALETTHDPIKLIAEEVGFHSLSQFNRSFSKYTGGSPSEFRESLSELEKKSLLAA